MLKGIERHMVVLKNTGSPLYEEAYFILNDEKTDNGILEADILAEANRIVAKEEKRFRGRPLLEGYGEKISFALGFVFSVAVTLTVFLIANNF